MNKEIEQWLEQGEPWLQYALAKHQSKPYPNINEAIQQKNIQEIITRIHHISLETQTLRVGDVSYKKTGGIYWDLFFLADIGFTIQQLQLEQTAEIILSMRDENGFYLTQAEDIKPHCFCIPTILLTSLVKMGCANDERIKKYIELIIANIRLDGGWHCAKSRSIGQRLEDTDSCPMSNMNVLMLLSQFEQYPNSSMFNGAIDLLLHHWQVKDEPWRPYGFGIGTDFLKLKYPAVKYGILRVVDTLSYYPYAVQSETFQEMLHYIKEKAIDGKYTPESIAKAYQDFDFGQKKEPSRWLTFLINRIEDRAKAVNKNEL